MIVRNYNLERKQNMQIVENCEIINKIIKSPVIIFSFLLTNDLLYIYICIFLFFIRENKKQKYAIRFVLDINLLINKKKYN